MLRTSCALFLLCASTWCAAQNPSDAIKPASGKHYRLTFVVSYPTGAEPTQTFSLDVPVLPGAPGESSMNFVSATANDSASAVQRTIQCSDVHQTASGLAAKVAITFDSQTSPTPASGSEPIHHHLQLERKIDVALGTPTVITGAAHSMSLGKGVGTAAPAPSSAPPQISVTATEI